MAGMALKGQYILVSKMIPVPQEVACVQTLQSVGRSEGRRKIPVESAQRRPILCFEFSDFVEPSGIGFTV